MTQVHELLYSEISKLPIEKVGKALAFVRYLEQETETELFLDSVEEAELNDLIGSDDFMSDAELLVEIEVLSNDLH